MQCIKVCEESSFIDKFVVENFKLMKDEECGGAGVVPKKR